MSTIETRNLDKSYGTFRAVSAFSHSFREGEITTIVGPSGSGKSTTLWLIAGLTRPDGGRILIDGADVTDRAAEHRDVGMVFQSYALFPHLSVRENVEFGLRVRGIAKDERRRRAHEVLELVHMERSAQRRIQKLSGGEQQRVALARALAFRPRILLMDEPLSALDAKLREELRDELLRLLNELKLTTIYVTHDQSEAMGLGSELIVMNHGRIEQAGTPTEVYNRPSSLFVAGFLGTANIFSARYDAGVIHLPFASVPSERAHSSGACSIMIRPEDFEVARNGEADFHAQIESVSFLGRHLQVRAKAHGHELLLDLRNDLLIQRDRPLGLRIRREKMFIWPEEQKEEA